MRNLILVIGHSHIAALHDGYAQDPGVCGGDEVAFVPVNGPAFSPPLVDGVLHPAIATMFAARRLVAVVTVLGGNMHNVIGLARDPVPFDTMLPERPTLPLPPDATLLPFGLIRRVLERRSQDLSHLMEAMRAATSLPMFQIESPPPIPSEAHLRAYPKGFAEVFAQHGIAPAPLRFKLWRANSAIMADLCTQHGITFLPVPPEMQDAEGMLAKEAWQADPTHGNHVYGAAVLRQIAAAR